MDIERKFIDLKFLDEEVVKRNKELLTNTFKIDIDKLIEKLNKEIDEKLFISNMNQWIDKVSIYVQLCMQEYSTNFEKHFPRIKDINDNFIEHYAKENLKLNLYLYFINKNKEKISLSQIEAVKKYIKTEKDNKLKETYLYNSNEMKKNNDLSLKTFNKLITDENCRNYSRVITMNLKKLKKINRDNEKLIALFFNDVYSKSNRNKKCKSEISNIFIELMHNIGKTNYGNEYKNRGKYKFELEIERMRKFFDKEVDIYEKYFWERINNTAFIKYSYDLINEINIDKDIFCNLVKYVMYLPNVFNNGNFLFQLVQKLYLGSESYIDYKAEFEEAIKNFCFKLAFLSIPLYNKIFSVIISETYRALNLSDKNYIIKQNFNEAKFYENYLYNQLEEKKIEEFRIVMILNIVRDIDFDLFDLNQIIDSIGVFDKRFLKIIDEIYYTDSYDTNFFNMKDEYRQLMNNFILNIIAFYRKK